MTEQFARERIASWHLEADRERLAHGDREPGSHSSRHGPFPVLGAAGGMAAWLKPVHRLVGRLVSAP
ncbi:MAG: hypothetical protein WEE50_09860 [Chloroflexota bacterium]